MSDVEKFARYYAPKYLSCYFDVLKQFLEDKGLNDLVLRMKDYKLNLEFGVETTTQISLIGLGLSRFSAIELSKTHMNDKMNKNEAIEWLKTLDVDSMDLSGIIKREIMKALER